jgi:hypothetical protein
MPISNIGVSVEEKETLSFFDYKPEKNALEATKSLSTVLNSVFLGDQHKVSSGDENIFWTNFTSQINYYPVWAGIKPQEIVANQDSTGLISHSGRHYTPTLLVAELDGPIHASAITTYENTTTVTDNFSVHGVRFRLGQALAVGAILHYELYIGTDDTGTRIFDQQITVTTPFAAGDFYELWFNHPSEEKNNTTVFAKTRVETEQDSNIFTPLQVYALAADINDHWVELRYRTFNDIEANFVGDYVLISEQLVSKSFANQDPTGLGLSNAIQVVFGAAATATNGCAKVYANGDIEILDNTLPCDLVVTVRAGRVGSAQVSKLIGWMEVATDGVTFVQPSTSDSAAIEFDSADVASREVFMITIDPALPNGTKLRLLFARDESGNNSGGLISFSPTATLSGLNANPSAQLVIKSHTTT